MNDNTAWIETVSGKKLNYSRVDPESIDIGDIAHALSQTNRFCGHTTQPFSVAAHSLLAAHMMASWAERGQKCVEAWALYGLLHDASEAYMADLPAPLKRMPELSGYREVEAELQRSIYVKFGLDPHQVPGELKTCDLALLAAEAMELRPPVFAGQWSLNWGLADLVPAALFRKVRIASALEVRTQFEACFATHHSKFPVCVPVAGAV